MPATILIVDDEPNIIVPLQFLMEQNGYRVLVARSGEEAIESIMQYRPDLILLDIMLPGIDGFEVCEIVRLNPEWRHTRIIFLTAKTMKEDKIRGFKIGGDDYITKPFSTEELNLRIEAILRRTRISLLDGEKDVSYQIGSYRFDYANQMLSGPSGEKRLTKKEAEVLRLLCINMNKILRREIALKMIWGDGVFLPSPGSRPGHFSFPSKSHLVRTYRKNIFGTSHILNTCM